MSYNPSSRWYIIFVRPVGSMIWTQHTKTTNNKYSIPWTTSIFKIAVEESKKISDNSNMSVHVIEIDHPTEIDDEQLITFSEESFELIVEYPEQ